MRSRFFAALALALVAPVLSMSAPARADDVADTPSTPSTPSTAIASSVEERAKQIKNQGDTAMESRLFAEANALYAKAYAIAADPALLYNQGRALEAMGDYPAALDMLERFAQAAPPELLARVPKLKELIADVRGRVGIVIFKVNVPGARIAVRQKVIGEISGMRSVPLRAGSADIEVTAEGYETYAEKVAIPAADSLTLDITLLEKHLVAYLNVKANPPGSVVFLDGRPIGPAPVETKIKAGTYRLRVTRPDYVDEAMGVTLAMGEHRDITVELHKPPPIYATWWFWTGAGAIVAAGVVTAVALSTEKAPGSGSIQPGQVRGPLVVGF